MTPEQRARECAAEISADLWWRDRDGTVMFDTEEIAAAITHHIRAAVGEGIRLERENCAILADEWNGPDPWKAKDEIAGAIRSRNRVETPTNAAGEPQQ